METEKRDEALRHNESFPLYTAKELAQMLGISPTVLARWRAQGGGPKFIAEARNSVVYLVSDVNAWLLKRRRERLTFPKLKAAAKKREAAKRAAKTPTKRRRSTRADPSASPAESPGA